MCPNRKQKKNRHNMLKIDLILPPFDEDDGQTIGSIVFKKEAAAK